MGDIRADDGILFLWHYLDRAASSLLRAGVRTVGQLAAMGDAELLSIPRFGSVSLARVDAALASIGACPGGGSWAELWRRNRRRGTANRIYAAVDAQTPEWRRAVIAGFVERAAEDNCGAGEIDGTFFQLDEMTEDADGTYFSPHPRCYAAMILARDRQVAAWQPCECLKFQGLVCPEHGVTSLYDECFMCRGCGFAYGACECDETTRDSIRDDGRRHILV